MKSKPVQRLLKRTLDILVSGIVLACVWPVMLVISILLLFDVGRPVLFRQKRPGYRGQPFFVLKYRTMSNERDENGKLLPDEKRLSRLGRIIRSTSLDELPQLLNVLKGDMSLVGPRPLLMEYLEIYTPEEQRRHEVPPGITGWAQVNGRNALSWKEKFRYDIWYVENWSLALDLRILLLTVRAVLSRRGVSRAGHATTTMYDGSN